MISAREAFASIDRALQGVRKDEDRILAMLKSATDEAERLRRTQADGYKALARLKLDALARDEIVGKLDGAEKRALDALRGRRAALDELSVRRTAQTGRIADLEEARLARTAERDEAAEAVDRAAAATEARMAEDAAWQAAERAVGDAESQAAAADAKARQAETDRDEKRRPYEADPLFMYLWNTGYGTPAYRAGTIVRLVDGKVAALVGYQTARANYHMLREIPERLREHAERLKSVVAEAVTVREAIEREALERDGILPLEAAEQAAEEALAAADADLAKARSDLEAMDQQLRGLLDESSDPALAGALDDLAATIAREDLRTLYRQAMATPTAEDDTIIKQLQETERALVRVTAEAEEVRRTAVELASRRAELERSEESFRRGGYDDPFGEFQDGAIIGTVLEGILRGALSSRHLEEALGKGYRRRQPRSGGGFGGGLRLPSGGRSGGGFRTGGRSGGGGFRTGGRF